MELSVTVFGGSNPGREDYQNALQLGRLLATAGYVVLTGGYMGTMEAVSRGASESGGRVVGVTCDEIEVWRPKKPNPWVQEEMRFPSLRQRLFALIDSCDAALALPGGAGTLAEIATMWSNLVTGAISPRPLILIGSGWRATFEQFFVSLGEFIPENQRRWLDFAADNEEAMKKLHNYFHPAGILAQ